MSSPLVKARWAQRAVVALCLVMSGCSSNSPTSPTRPPGPTPPGGNDPRPPLSVTCPANQTVTATNTSSVTVTFTPPVVSGGVAPVQSSCTPASASLFPLGATTVRCSATDALQATASCTFTVTVSAPVPQLTRTKFLAFGDSMTAGEVTQPAGPLSEGQFANLRFVIVPSASYPTQLLNQLRSRYTSQTAQLQVNNQGKPGEWAEDGALRLPNVLANGRPEVVLLLEGVNDVAALGTPGIQRAARAIDTMAREVRQRGARLFLATVPPTRTTGPNSVPLASIQSLNAMIRTTARGENAVLVDVYSAISTDITRYIGVDGVHPTEAGYQRIADTFFAAIAADLTATR